MEVDDFVDKHVQNLPLETLFPEDYPSEIFRHFKDLDYDQLAKILQLDGETAVECVSKKPVERALRTWITVHGEEATVGNFARQLIKHGHIHLLKSALDSIDTFDVYLGGADWEFARAFLDSAELRHILKVFFPERDMMPNVNIADSIYTQMTRSRFIVLALPIKPDSDEHWAKFEQQLAVNLRCDLDKTFRTLIPVVYERSSVPPILQCFSPLVKRGEENLDQFCDRICETILDQQKSQRRGTGLLAKCQKYADQPSKEEKGAGCAVPVKTSIPDTQRHSSSLLKALALTKDFFQHVSRNTSRRLSNPIQLLSGFSNVFQGLAWSAQMGTVFTGAAPTSGQGILVPPKPVSEARHCDTDGVPQPVFSEDWQFQGSFSTTGGQLRGQNSDVILVIPEHAVRDASQESVSAVADQKCLRNKATSFQVNDWQACSGSVAHDINNDVIKRGAIITDLDAREINDDVIIRGAISTDLQRVHETLHLGRCESVRSPVAEYYAGENFSFQKPISISIPLFLPPGFSVADVRVYQFHRDSDGQILINTLKPLKAEDTTEKHTASNTPGTSAENDVTATEGFYFTDDNRIQVVTSHFSGYLCTLCKKEMDPPHLRLRLYGKHVQRQSRDVDLTLFIWDLRLDIRDFRKAGLPNQEDEKTFLMSQTLEPLPTTSNIENLELGSSLYLSEQDSAIWIHWSRNDAPAFPPQRRIGIKKFVPCCLDTIPERVDWALLTRHDPGQLKWFQCMLDVGYVTSASDDVPLQFLPVPRIQTFRIRGLELTNEQRSTTTQTDQHLMEDTHVKQLEGNFTSPRTTAEAPTTASSPPFSLPQTASIQGASAYHGQRQYVATASMPASLGEGMAAMTLNPGGAAPNFSRPAPVQEQNADTSFNPEGAMLNQQMSAMAPRPPESALSPSRDYHVTRSGGEGDNSTKQVIYTNCTFNMQANKTTTNNNVGKLHDMNFGNTTNIATEGDQAEGSTPHHVTPPHHVTEPRIEFPDVAEVLQQSLAQQAENEPRQ